MNSLYDPAAALAFFKSAFALMLMSVMVGRLRLLTERLE